MNQPESAEFWPESSSGAPDLVDRLAKPVEPDGSNGSSWIGATLLAAITVCFAVVALLVPKWNVNWDEFHYLSYIHDAARSELVQRWVTFHVHLFGWLPGAGDDEIEQILAARYALFVLLLGSAWLIFSIARRFVSRDAALFAVLAFVSFSYVVRHGVSFRPDPICAFLLLLALRLSLPPFRAARAAAAGLAMALSTMLTPKVAMHLCLLVALLGLIGLASRTHRRHRTTLRRHAAVFLLAFGGSLTLLFLLHDRAVNEAVTAESGAFLSRSAVKVLGGGVLLPQPRFVLDSLRNDSAVWILIGAGAALAAIGVYRRGRGISWELVMLLLFALPLTSLLFYRNSFPYYYVFILPPAVLTAAYAVERMLDRRRRGGSLVWSALVVALALATTSSALSFYSRHRADQTAQQRQLLAVVHRLFPVPVAYIDRCSMVASYPKVGFFMSSWGLQRYRQSGKPIFRELLEERPVPFLIANSYSLAISLPDAAVAGKPFSLLREDLALLRDNFLPHWGILYVQGKSFDFRDETGPREFEILSRGPFTVESDGGVELDGAAAAHGDVRELAAGWHRIAPSPGTTFARLRWGDRLPVPSFAPIAAPIFTDF